MVVFLYPDYFLSILSNRHIITEKLIILKEDKEMDIKDFGEKIGGARKDMYNVLNLAELNSAELAKVVRDKIWKRPNIQKELEKGTDRLLLYWREQIRKSITTKPVFSTKYDKDELCRAYIEVVNRIKAFAEECTVVDSEGLKDITDDLFVLEGRYVHARNISGQSIYNAALYNLARMDKTRLNRKMCKERFGMTADEKLTEDVAAGLEVCKFLGNYTKQNEPTFSPLMTEYICYFLDDEVYDKTKNMKALKVKSSHITGTIYLYEHNNPYFNAQWEKDTYVVLNYARGYHVLYINIDSKEAAKEKVKQYVSASVSVIKSEKANSRKKRKQNFPRQLADVVQKNGAQTIWDVTGDMYMETFGFRAGEFGNWMSEKDRQISLNMGYVALQNLAHALDLDNKTMSLGGKLAIAFGARGQSSARAHYEPNRNVINLTKMTGAGSLAHEWGHAFDSYVASLTGYQGMCSSMLRKAVIYPNQEIRLIFDKFFEIIKTMQNKAVLQKHDYSEGLKKRQNMMINTIKYYVGSVPTDYAKAFSVLIEELTAPDSNITAETFSDFRKKISGRCIPKESREQIDMQIRVYKMLADDIKENGAVRDIKKEEPTEYMKGSEFFDKTFKKDGDYWSSKVEMFARAFDCYVEDKLKELGITDTYLTDSASGYAWVTEDKTVYRAYPYGEEREKLNSLFDQLFSMIRELK